MEEFIIINNHNKEEINILKYKYDINILKEENKSLKTRLFKLTKELLLYKYNNNKREIKNNIIPVIYYCFDCNSSNCRC